MIPVLACMVCARPLDALLTSGLHAGVAVMALVALGVMAALVRGVLRLLREDRAALAAINLNVGQSFSSAGGGRSARSGSSKELPYVSQELPYVSQELPYVETSDGSRASG